MIKRITLIVFAALVFSAGAASVSAQKWESLGSKEVKDRSKQDTWHVGRGKGQFRKLRLEVQSRPVRFYKLVVTYGNGEKQELEIRSLIRAGGQSRAFDLDGKDRYIDKVDVWYEAATARRGVRSRVTLYGHK